MRIARASVSVCFVLSEKRATIGIVAGCHHASRALLDEDVLPTVYGQIVYQAVPLLMFTFVTRWQLVL